MVWREEGEGMYGEREVKGWYGEDIMHTHPTHTHTHKTTPTHTHTHTHNTHIHTQHTQDYTHA